MSVEIPKILEMTSALLFIISMVGIYPTVVEYSRKKEEAKKKGFIPPSYSSYIKKVKPYLIILFFCLVLEIIALFGA